MKGGREGGREGGRKEEEKATIIMEIILLTSHLCMDPWGNITGVYGTGSQLGLSVWLVDIFLHGAMHHAILVFQVR